MLACARQLTLATRNLHYQQAELGLIDLDKNSLNLVISLLALHYVADFRSLAARIASALRPGGSFIFSVEHPVVTCAARKWVCQADGSRTHWPVDHYLEEGGRSIDWMGFENIPRQHLTISTYVNVLLDCGLSISRLLEPGPTDADIAKWPHLADHRRRPAFLVIRADKPA